MSAGEAPVPSRRNWWVIGAFATLAAVLVGMKCLCEDPFEAMRRQSTSVADVRGAPLRAALPATPETPTAAAPAGESPSIAAAPTVEQPEAPAPSTTQATAPVREPVASPPPAAGEAPIAVKEAEKTAEAPPAGAAKPEPRFKVVTWEDIGDYVYVPPMPDDDPTTTAAPASDKAALDQIPAAIRAMAGKRISIEGYVMAYEFEKGIVKKAILMTSPLACCFAEAPPMNRWIMVSNDGKSEFSDGKYEVVRVSGVFDVGEETREGYVVSIYRMKAEKIENVNE